MHPLPAQISNIRKSLANFLTRHEWTTSISAKKNERVNIPI